MLVDPATSFRTVQQLNKENQFMDPFLAACLGFVVKKIILFPFRRTKPVRLPKPAKLFIRRPPTSHPWGCPCPLCRF